LLFSYNFYSLEFATLKAKLKISELELLIEKLYCSQEILGVIII